MEDSGDSPFRSLLNPVVLIAVSILLSVFVLIGAAIIGWDKGVLIGMSRVEFARGLITYLFAVVTIGTAVVLVVSALTTVETETTEKRFQRGKEILSLLLGVFGTIVGFYFGSEVQAKTRAEEVVEIQALRVSNPNPVSGETITVRTIVTGGQPPYMYAVGFEGEALGKMEPVGRDGWIEKELTVPQVTAEAERTLRVEVIDADDHTSSRSLKLMLKPKP